MSGDSERRRADALIPFSHDHHHALGHARRLRRDASGEPEVRMIRAREFLSFFESDSVAHFRKEEEELFPLVVRHREIRPLLMQLLIEHVEIHALVRRLEGEIESYAVRGETLAELGGKLHDHVRLEERTVFPLIERLAGF